MLFFCAFLLYARWYFNPLFYYVGVYLLGSKAVKHSSLNGGGLITWQLSIVPPFRKMTLWRIVEEK